MPGSCRLHIHRLDVPPGRGAACDVALPHRNIPGCGLVTGAGGIADSALLLLTGGLVAEEDWLAQGPSDNSCCCESPELVQHLRASGLLTPAASPQEDADLGQQVDEMVEAAVSGYGPWLEAVRDAAEMWSAYERLGGSVWDAIHPSGPGWRDHLQQAGMSLTKHNYRNQSQAVTALMQLVEWQGGDDIEESMVRDAIVKELVYVFSSLSRARDLGVVAHDWSDMLPVYRMCATGDGAAILRVRVPGLRASPADEVGDLLTDPGLAAARELVSTAIDEGGIDGREVEQELLQAVPRDMRTPYAFREVSFYSLNCGEAGLSSLAGDGMILAITDWRGTGLPGH